mmetsp:Transcript_44028/g.126101  ORF Transcript_44028/g.126101 Transcript_44028/m.126101 type:complete len:498 (-) Transcript_44028:65-1558(-)
MPAAPLPVAFARTPPKAAGAGEATKPAPAPGKSTKVAPDVQVEDQYDAYRRVAEKFGNFKSAVQLGKQRTTDSASLRDQRYRMFGERAEACDDDGEKQVAAKSFLDRETLAVRGKRKKWTTEDFQPVVVLGKGAFGVVHLVNLKGTETYYALKQMKKSRYAKKNYRERAYAERECLAGARSRWFVELLATFQDSDHVYMVMEFVQGGELFKHIEMKERMSLQETQFYMAELLEAIDTVHRHGFVHRDVKPDNIVLTKDGHLKLLDFGLCKPDPNEADDDNKEVGPKPGTRRAKLNSRVGTPQYMSPEAYVGDARASSDLWAMGVVTFECLYGGLPFHAGEKEGHEAILLISTQVREHARTFPKRLQKAKQHGFMPPEAEAMLLRLICRESERADAKALRQDPFFAGIDFATIHEQTPVIVPQLRGPTDTTYFDSMGRSQALPKHQRGVPKDHSLEWAHYEFDRETNELERPANVHEAWQSLCCDAPLWKATPQHLRS